MRATRNRRLLVATFIVTVVAAASSHATTEARQARLAVTSIELEDLVNAVKTSGGQVARQAMQGFGQGWSGAQLFWRAPAPVDSPIRNWPHLDFGFDVPAGGTYDVVLRHTVAPDFATFRVFLDGGAVADVDGYAASVAPRAHPLGSHELKAGRHQIVITVFTKAAAATGYAVGLDRLDLRLRTSGTGAADGGRSVANAVTLDAGRRLVEVSEPRALSRAGLDDAARISAISALGGVFANVHQVQSTFRWSADAPVIPGRGYMGGENLFVGAPEPLTMAFRVGAAASSVRLVAKGLQADPYLLQCALRVKPGTTLELYQVGPAQPPGYAPVPSVKLLDVTPSHVSDEPYLFLTGFKVPQPGTYAFLISGRKASGVGETTNYVEVSFCELSLMK